MLQPLVISKFNTKGFTLVEALVALAILTAGLIPVFTQASAALRLSMSVRNTMIATGLAQEGLEVVRAIRDENWYAGRSFDSGLDMCDAGCRVQYNSNVLMLLNANPPLKRDVGTLLMQYDTGVETIFTRSITITSVASYALKVTSTVAWAEGSDAKSFEVDTYLFDWAQ
jgi:prepilin-type N-terminal cleavage/methylation domain-containing protein